MTDRVIDLYAGPGGWDVAAATLGVYPIGYEYDAAACATRAAAGHLTVRQDVAGAWVPAHDGLIASPPCQAFSMAGKRKGHDDLGRIYRWMVACADGWVEDPTKSHDGACEPGWLDEDGDPTQGCLVGDCWSDLRSRHILQPLRWAWCGNPEWIALEQVPPCLPVWELVLQILEGWGYKGWTAVLNAADYGVPQTRRRAILAASRTRMPDRPEVTHVDPRKGDSLFHQPWQSMAAALGWCGMRLDRRQTQNGGAEPVVQVDARRPSPSVTTVTGQWVLRNNNQEKAAVRTLDRPAGTGHALNSIEWVRERPATSVCGDTRISAPGYRGRPDDYAEDGTYTGDRSMDEAIKVELWELAVLQGFPRDYPFQGSKTKRAEQIGNAVPPGLAAAVLRTVAHAEEADR